MKIPEFEAIPCWYELSVVSQHTILIRVRAEMFEYLKKYTAQEYFLALGRKFNLPKFTPVRLKSWGYGSIFKPAVDEDPCWICWHVKLPRMKRCTGTKTMQTVCSLQVLFDALCFAFVDFETASPQNQLIVIDHLSLPTGNSLGQAGLCATLTPSAADWIASLPQNEHLMDIVQAMKVAHDYMWPGASRYERFSAMCMNKMLYLDVPGNACDLSPAGYQQIMSEGYKLVPHNVDSLLQQLTFVVGLAKLHDLVRADQTQKG